MDQESTPTGEPEGQEPRAAAEGQEPSTPAQEEADAKTFSSDYVRQLRKEAAQTRTRLNDAEGKLRELTDRDKSETERLTERAGELEKRATEAESRLIRYEVAAAKGLDPRLIGNLTGATREEVEASADTLGSVLAEHQPAPPRGFDGGARQTPETKGSPEQEHSKTLMALLGRPR